MKDLSFQKTVPQELESSEVFKLQSADIESMESARNEPFDIFDDKAIVRQNTRTSNPVKSFKPGRKRLLNLQLSKKHQYLNQIHKEEKKLFLFNLETSQSSISTSVASSITTSSSAPI